MVDLSISIQIVGSIPSRPRFVSKRLQPESAMTSFKQSLASIVEPRGRFDMIDAQPAGKPATVGFVFRNAEQATSRPRKSTLKNCLTDIKQFYKTHRPNQQPNFGGQKRYPPGIVEPSDLFSTSRSTNIS